MPARLDQRSVRRHNLAVVLEHLSEHGPRSRATIAAETGLNKTTVSSLVSSLMERGLVRESTRPQHRTVGRPATSVELNGEGVVGLGLEINVDYLAVLTLDLLGRERHRVIVPCDNRGSSPSRVMTRLARIATDVIRTADAEGLVTVAAALAVPGLVDIERGRLFVAPNLHWQDVRIATLLRRRLDRPAVPIFVDNEANLAALAELWEGAGRGLRQFVYVSGEVGVGGGIVIDGELMRGSGGFAGELGHIVVDPDGPACGCGRNGCLEAYVGQEALLRTAGLAFLGGPGRHAADDWLPALAEAAAEQPAVAGALAQVGHWLGVGLAGVANLLNPQAIVLGGYFAPLAPWLEGPMVEELSRRVLANPYGDVEVVASQLGPDAAVRGAATLCLREVLADPGALDTLVEVS